ncbi:MAG: ferritin family protein [Thermodesulfovibrionales bacterium]|nr:ferritin family protein [Thermodesulfovibrionales bacterium]
MESYSVLEVVEMAIRTEKLGQEFYTGMAGKFEADQGLRDLFTRLATMELKHERTFTGLLEKIKDPEPHEWTEAQYYFRAMIESEFFLGSGKSLPTLDHVKTVADATDFAIGFEKETTLFFTGMRSAVADSDRPVVDKIIEEEMSHIAILKRFRESLELEG